MRKGSSERIEPGKEAEGEGDREMREKRQTGQMEEIRRGEAEQIVRNQRNLELWTGNENVG